MPLLFVCQYRLPFLRQKLRKHIVFEGPSRQEAGHMGSLPVHRKLGAVENHGVQSHKSPLGYIKGFHRIHAEFSARQGRAHKNDNIVI